MAAGGEQHMSIIPGGGPSRRRVLLGSGAVLAGAGIGAGGSHLAAVPPAAGSADPAGLDRDLLALCHEFHRAYEAACETLDDEPLFEQKEAREAWFQHSHDVAMHYYDVVEAIISKRPKTPQGMLAKASVASLVVRSVYENAAGEVELDYTHKLTLTFAEDFMALHGVSPSHPNAEQTS
jgi:hypothetical protein